MDPRLSSLILSLVVLTHLGCKATSKPELPAPAGPSRQKKGQRPVAATATFTDVAASWGIDFTHDTGATGKYYFPEIMGSGCALLDYDDDGDLDVYLVQGGHLGPPTAGAPVGRPPRNRLFRNELIAGGVRGDRVRFTDVTDESGAGDTGYGMGVATADYDNDGDVDLYVTNFGPDVLLRNNADGTFTDVTAAAGLGDPRWTTGAAFVDYDRDGHLDLVVVAYAEFTVATHMDCFSPRGRPDYCGQTPYPAIPGRLYANRGDGTFRNVSAATGFEKAYGHGLGIGIADFDGNGWTDIYVANDEDNNQLWLNSGGKIADAGLLSGAAVNHAGVTEGGMGVSISDFDDDGDADIFLTHFVDETNTLYENVGGGFFEDRTTSYRLGLPSLPRTGFGVAAFDADHDGALDILVVNGAVRIIDSLKGDPYPYHERNQLFVQLADGTFADRSHAAGSGLALSDVSRGLAAGDVDNDGDVDVLIANNKGPVRLLRNDLSPQSNWIILRVRRSSDGRDAIGAKVRLTLDDDRVLTRYVTTSGSYLSASDPRVHFGWPAEVGIRSIGIGLPGAEIRMISVPATRTISTVIIDAPATEDGRHAVSLGKTEVTAAGDPPPEGRPPLDGCPPSGPLSHTFGGDTALPVPGNSAVAVTMAGMVVGSDGALRLDASMTAPQPVYSIVLKGECGAAPCAWTFLAVDRELSRQSSVLTQVRAGDTLAPDATWGPWTRNGPAAANAFDPPLRGRYLQIDFILMAANRKAGAALWGFRACYAAP